ncbi:MAG TPA: response regulator transcription factor, partial [Bacteroidales bacterium]|nr:response regulator transcription factor [Bacteroidales bacterium]
LAFDKPEINNQILLVEDDKHFAYVLKSFLTTKGYDVDWYENGEIALEKYKNNPFYHLMLVDIMMPKKDGITLVKEIRTINPSIPIIFITAKSQNEDILTGYEVGADDYVIKPFSVDILLARIQVLLNRVYPQSNITKLEAGNSILDVNRNVLILNNKEEIKLSPIELEILKILFQNINNITTKNELLMHLYGDVDYFKSR